METLKTFSREEINFELQRALNFPLLKSSPVLSSFLKYIVYETIEGRDRHIKEYSIAVNALNRGENFDSQEDAVVRIHAGRLRRILNEYYLTDGMGSLIIISIPKGSYVPHFTAANKTNTSRLTFENGYSTKTKPVIAVFPFKPITPGHETAIFSQLLSEEFSAELSKYKETCIIGYHSAGVMAKINENILEAGKLAGADYIITGIIQYIKKQAHIRASLLTTATGEVLITKVINKEVSRSLFELQDEIIRAVADIVEEYCAVLCPKRDYEA